MTPRERWRPALRRILVPAGEGLRSYRGTAVLVAASATSALVSALGAARQPPARHLSGAGQ
jgi:hypothetical protein